MSGRDSGTGEWEVESPERPPCAFCLQKVDVPGRTTCRNCRAVYHPDCWAANDGRCAIYGCGSLPKPPPAPAPIPRWREPAAPAPAGSRWGWLLLITLIAAFNLARMAGNRSSTGAGDIPPRVERRTLSPSDLSTFSSPDEAIRQAQALLDETRPLIRFLEAGKHRDLPAVEREALRSRIRLAASSLQRAREILRRYPSSMMGASAIDLMGDADGALEMLRKADDELRGP